MAAVASTQGDALGRLVVVNWAEDALGLVRALQELGATDLVLVGTQAPEVVEASIARHLSGRADEHDALWDMVALHAWAERFGAT